ncbi:MAG: mycothiol-dependent nitroreductase Rv2466c family protein [Sporichthyaceae bacterium]
MTESDLHFYFDPVCPFAWLTSTWVRQVMAARDYRVGWRLISLRVMNSHIDYDAHFPQDYEQGHTAGLRMLRVAARARAEHGPGALDGLQSAYGQAIFDRSWPQGSAYLETVGSEPMVRDALREAGLPTELAGALGDERWDDEIAKETNSALELTGRDVGTPILHIAPPDGVAFFGPVISRRPSDAEALELWDHVVALARFGGFAEFKRSLRERPQLRSFGFDPDAAAPGQVEEWHQGSRRLKK